MEISEPALPILAYSADFMLLYTEYIPIFRKDCRFNNIYVCNVYRIFYSIRYLIWAKLKN